MPAIGELISSSDFNTLVSTYNKFWADTCAGCAFTDADNTPHQYGWGQLQVEPTVIATELITESDTNRLLNQVNAGLYHILYDSVNASSDLQNRLLHKIYTADYNSLGFINNSRDIMAAFFEHVEQTVNAIDPIKTDLAGVRSTLIEDSISNNSLEWKTSSDVVLTATFDNYNQARYFFNSGGNIFVQLDAFGGAYGADQWNGIFDYIQSVHIGATSTSSINNVGTGFGGFYNLKSTNQDFITLFTAIGGDNCGSYGGYGGYGGYGSYGSYGSYGCYSSYSSYGGYGEYGGYSNRAIVISGKCIQTENDFSVLIKITLEDDILDTDSLFNTNITCDYGYHTAATTDPNPNISLFQTDSYIYKFIQRTPPTIAVYQDWTTTDNI